MIKKKAIVLEGGGVLGAAQPAILKLLHTQGKIDLNEYSVFVGTSVGALNAAALSCDMTISDLCDMWHNVNVKDLMPRRWWSIIRGKRINMIDQFVAETILKALKFKEDLTCKELFEETGNEFYSVATALQNNKGIIFGHNWHNIQLKDACKFTTSHPIVFDTNEYHHKGKIYDLTDGGIIQNCPVSVLVNRDDISEVLCIAVEQEEETKQRYTNFISVLKRIMGGIVSRNEIQSYAIAHKRWGDKFRLVKCVLNKDIDIFDVTKIDSIMESAIEKMCFSDPITLSEWVLPNAKLKKEDHIFDLHQLEVEKLIKGKNKNEKNI